MSIVDAHLSPSSPTIPPTYNSLTKKRRKSYMEEEDIVVKPSTELIPDEYEHFSNDTVLLHIFRTTEDDCFDDKLLETLVGINYGVTPKANLHYLDEKATFFNDLESIKKGLANKSALIIIFLGFFKKDGCLFMIDENSESAESNIHIRDIWNMFTANNCPELKDKPKMFFFCTSPPPSRVQADTVRHHTMRFDKVYDFPAESDILIVYMKTDDTTQKVKSDFINQLCGNIKVFSRKHDIIDLVSYMQKHVPLVISTLTRKFYLVPSGEREHYLSIVENNDTLDHRLRIIKESVEKLHLMQKKKKEKKFISFPSFKRKSEDKPKIVKKDEKSKKTDKPKPVESPRFSASSPTPVGRRSRNQSETDNNDRKLSISTSPTKKKPYWRP